MAGVGSYNSSTLGDVWRLKIPFPAVDFGQVGANFREVERCFNRLPFDTPMLWITDTTGVSAPSGTVTNLDMTGGSFLINNNFTFNSFDPTLAVATKEGLYQVTYTVGVFGSTGAAPIFHGVGVTDVLGKGPYPTPRLFQGSATRDSVAAGSFLVPVAASGTIQIFVNQFTGSAATCFIDSVTMEWRRPYTG